MNLKKYFVFSFLFFIFCSFCFSQTYIINSVNYEITGKTKKEYLDNKLNIEIKKEFETENNLNNYLDEIKQKLDNIRVIESYEVLTEIILEENYFVNLIIKTVDTKNFIALPYPKYDTNEGFVAKIKLRDSNLFGTISALDAELLYAYTEKQDYKVGALFDFNIPFYLNSLGLNLFSEFESSYFIKEKKFLFDTETGFEFYYPIIKPIIKIGLNQTADYNTKKTLFNEWFLSECVFVKLPFYFNDYTFSVITNFKTDIIPNINYSNQIGFNLYKNSVNWIENFRQGFFIDTSLYLNLFYNQFEYNFTFENNFIYYKSFDKLAFATRLNIFLNPSENEVGSFIRGITDSELVSDLGFIANLDLPISLFKINKNKFYDFELQISPFVDFGYTYQNEFHISGGLEFLVYPRITRSLQLRVSGGISKNDLELFIGIGLFY